MIRLNLRLARWLAAIVLGSTLLLLGAIMLLTPGPGIPTLLGGLVVLSSEVVWARNLLKHVRARLGMKEPLPIAEPVEKHVQD